MRFERITPPLELKNLIECYWTVEDDDPSPQIQKIIPDGFPEVIFHFGDPYRIKLLDRWETQDMNLLAGQITKIFFLQNTGRSEILGIKFKPQGLAHLFNIPMHTLTDKVLNLNDVMMDQWGEMERVVRVSQHMTDRITLVESYLKELITPLMTREEAIDLALLAIFSARGAISVAEIGRAAAISERQLERLFKHYVGLSPKFYSRVIRFSYIFQLVKERKMSWSELGLASGFYDQSHFIRNFKVFTGEDPTRYFFDEPNLANFFLRK